MSMDAAALRITLTETRDRLARRDADIAAAADAGISKTDIARLTGLSRQHIYEVLTRRENAKNRAEEAEVNDVQAMWELGKVVQDRWGLRWRADLFTSRGLSGEEAKRWQCRSVGLRVSLSHAKMAERKPLVEVRVDQVFAGPMGSSEQKAAVAARQTGEAEDAAVTVEPHEDPEP